MEGVCVCVCVSHINSWMNSGVSIMSVRLDELHFPVVIFVCFWLKDPSQRTFLEHVGTGRKQVIFSLFMCFFPNWCTATPDSGMVYVFQHLFLDSSTSEMVECTKIH